VAKCIRTGLPERPTMNAEQICNRLGEMREAGAAMDSILTSAVAMIHEAEEAFHWTGIYELFPDEVLRLGPFIGAPTDHVFIGVGQGVCGSAVADRCNKNVPDVTKESNYLACSSSTRSELVVLIRKGDTIFAQIDIDSHDFDAFDESVESEVEKIANWLSELYASQNEPNPTAA